jgi:hypothetical protein
MLKSWRDVAIARLTDRGESSENGTLPSGQRLGPGEGRISMPARSQVESVEDQIRDEPSPSIVPP